MKKVPALDPDKSSTHFQDRQTLRSKNAWHDNSKIAF
jgi:hypothetical protein